MPDACNDLPVVLSHAASSEGELQVHWVEHLQLQLGTTDSFEAGLDTEHILPTFPSSDFPRLPK